MTHFNAFNQNNVLFTWFNTKEEAIAYKERMAKRGNYMTIIENHNLIKNYAHAIATGKVIA